MAHLVRSIFYAVFGVIFLAALMIIVTEFEQFGPKKSSRIVRTHSLIKPLTHKIIDCTNEHFEESYNYKKMYKSNPCQLKILIVGQYHGGSGLPSMSPSSVFKVNPYSLHYFEPLAVYDVETIENSGTSLKKQLPEKQIEVLTDIFNCTVPNLDKIITDDYLKLVANYRSQQKVDQMEFWKTIGLVFPNQLKELSKDPFCPSGKFKDCHNKIKKYVDNGHWSNMCRSRQMVTAKVARLEDPGVQILLESDFFKYDPQFKIIVVIRDPRAIINSRLESKKNTQYSTTISGQRDQFIIKQARRLRERYLSYVKLMRDQKIFSSSESSPKILILRYEDFASTGKNFLMNFKLFKDFLNIDIANNPEEKSNYLKIRKLLQQESSRDIGLTISNWLLPSSKDSDQYLSWKDIEMIQNNFGDDEFWKLFGYRRISSHSQYINEFQKPLYNDDQTDVETVDDEWFGKS